MLKKLFIIFNIIFNINLLYASNDKLIFASELIRHGERTPHIDIPNLPNNWPQGVGQLTTNGIKQEYDLGRQARDIYINKYKLIDENYNLKQVYTRSSGYDRTLMSANAFLQGMFSSDCTNIQPFAIHSVPIDQDTLLLGSDVHQDKILAIAGTNPKLKDFHLMLNTRFKKLGDRIGAKINNLKDLIHVADALYIRKQMRQQLPNAISIQDIYSLYGESRKVLAMSLEMPPAGALAARDLINNISNNINNVISNKSDARKFILYSGHDVSILALLSGLGTPIAISPPYASHVSIQLFEKSSSSNHKHYYLKVLLNNNEINLPSCKARKYCTLTEFNHIVEQTNIVANKLLV